MPVPPPVTRAVNSETSNNLDALSSSFVFFPVAIVRMGKVERELINVRKELDSRRCVNILSISSYQS